MNVKKKLALLELAGGLLRWLWLIAGFAAVVSLVGALFFDWPWSRFLWAVGISVLGKWMLRGFKENQLRVYAEAAQRGELHPGRSSRAMRNMIGGGLVGLGYVSGLVFGLWALILDAGILLTAGGVLFLVAGIFVFPVTIAITPLYAVIAWGDWHPLRVTVAGTLMSFIFMGVGSAIVRKNVRQV